MKLNNYSGAFEVRFNYEDFIVPKGEFDVLDGLGSHILKCAKKWKKKVNRVNSANDLEEKKIIQRQGKPEEITKESPVLRKIMAKIADMRIDDLRIDLEKMELPTEGSKSELVERLQKATVKIGNDAVKPKEKDEVKELKIAGNK